ncbi:hypothetical protein PR003_g9830 [Phytophthora rubi]|uniref:Uncharacterized protein n=1 Tax=Phytophthora rubi TaxID=129364 RepID=A0A6A4FH20_9STRA|nr:hypothetical protein PR002_g9175 [Phytophthora rubi]KAE9341732.1 hypothetical protein PR003_g9830 [Phytophthora rubi]
MPFTEQERSTHESKGDAWNRAGVDTEGGHWAEGKGGGGGWNSGKKRARTTSAIRL